MDQIPSGASGFNGFVLSFRRTGFTFPLVRGGNLDGSQFEFTTSYAAQVTFE
jgi:hypothetical protein